MKEPMLTVEEVARLLNVHWQTVHNYIKRGELRAIKLGRGYRIEPDDLNAFVQSRATKRSDK